MQDAAARRFKEDVYSEKGVWDVQDEEKYPFCFRSDVCNTSGGKSFMRISCWVDADLKSSAHCVLHIGVN